MKYNIFTIFIGAFSLFGCDVSHYCKWHLKADYSVCQGDEECISREQMKADHAINRCMENWTNYSINYDRVRGEDGTLWAVIQCRNHDRCLEDIGDVCPNGYIIADRNTMIQGRSFYYNGSGGSKLATTETIMFQCKKPVDPSLGY